MASLGSRRWRKANTDGQPRAAAARSTHGGLTVVDRIVAGLGISALVAGIVLLGASSVYTVSIVGVGLLGLAGVAFVALAFLIVGESEDRDYRKRAL